MKKEGYRRKTTFEKKKIGLARVIGRPGLAGSLHGLSLTNPNQSNHRIPHRPIRPVWV
jgi:hypothetical protein